MPRIALMNDYQEVALRCADWGSLPADCEIEVFQLAKPGDRLTAKSRIADIYEKEGRSGRMVFIVTETTIWNDKGELLLVSRQAIIRR